MAWSGERRRHAEVARKKRIKLTKMPVNHWCESAGGVRYHVISKDCMKKR